MAAPEPSAGAAHSATEGRGLRRFATGYVALVFAVHAGGFAQALTGLIVGAIVAVVGFAGAVLVLRLMFGSALGRRTFWTLFALHVAFWSGSAYLRTTLRPPGPIQAAASAAWSGTEQPFLAGVGEAFFDLHDGDPIAGWGQGRRRTAWPDAMGLGPFGRLSMDAMGPSADGAAPRSALLASGVLGEEKLGARALVLRPASGRSSPLVICRLDLVTSDARIHREVLAEVRDLGIVPEMLLLPATHTHSGPGGYSDVRLSCLAGTDHLQPRMSNLIVRAAVAAIRKAFETAVPAQIAFVRAHDRGADGRPILALNRRHGPENADSIDDEVLGIRVDAAEGGKRIALLLNYAVHPVWGRPTNLTFSGDLAAHLERSAAIGDGAMVLFVNGAEGDIGPRAHRPSPEAPHSVEPFEAVVAAAFKEEHGTTLLHVSSATVRRDFGSAHSFACVGSRALFRPAVERLFGEGGKGIAAGVLTLPINAAVWSAGLDDVRLGFTFGGASGAVVSLDAYLDHTTFPVGAVRLVTPDATAVILWTPIEATHTVGLAMKASARGRGADPVFVFGLTNDSMGYCTSPGEYDEGGYESTTTFFGPETSLRLRESVDAALDAVGYGLR